MFSTMAQIIFCDDLILRVDESEDLTNVTEWLLESTEYRPTTPESCTVRTEMTPNGKFGVILSVWLVLIIFTFLYFYFCEWRLFPEKNRLKEMEGYGACCSPECGNSKSQKLEKQNSRTSLSSGVSCDGTCCNTDMTSLSSRATSPTWTTSDTIPTSTTRSRFASLTSPTSSYKSYRSPYNHNSSSNLVQLDRSPQRRGPQGRGWVEFGGQSLTTSHKQTSRAKYRSLRV